MAIKGSLKEAALPDVLQLLSMGKKTGCLSVGHRNTFGSIYFDRGRISFASIVNRRDRLGDLLIKTGALSPPALEAAIDAQRKQPHRRLGELLVERGDITREQLERCIVTQIEEAVYELFTWPDGAFNFESDVRPDSQDVLVSINPEALLLEGARRVDEWSQIAKKIPSFDLIFEIDLPKVLASDAALTADQRAVLDLVDGSRDVRGIVDASDLGEFEVAQAMYGLVTAGFVHRVGRSATETVASPSHFGAEEHRNVGLAYYRSQMYVEALRELRRSLEEHPDDLEAQVHVGLIHARQGNWDEARRCFDEAARLPGSDAAVFHNLAVALEQQGRLAEAREALREAEQRAGNDGRIQTSAGVAALLAGDLLSAERCFARARTFFGSAVPPVAWFHYAALSAAGGRSPERAAAILQEGVAAHPEAAVLHNNLAVVLERLGRYEEAMAAVLAGLRAAPHMPQLHKNMGDLHYRGGRYEEALQSFVTATSTHANLGSDVYVKLGTIRQRRQEMDEAVRCWQRALELDPENAAAAASLATTARVTP